MTSNHVQGLPIDNLDDKLRSMILGNEKIASEPKPGSMHPNKLHANGRERDFNSPKQVANAHVSTFRGPNTSGRGQVQTRQFQVLQREKESNDFQTSKKSNNYGRGRGRGSLYSGRAAPSKFTPLHRQTQSVTEAFNSQCMYLENLAAGILPEVEMSAAEWHAKDEFRLKLEQICQEVAGSNFQSSSPSVQLIAFGSLSSGFAMPGSDMDLALVMSEIQPDVPRLVEEAMLRLGIGARLLTRTRVPILKVCQSPNETLFTALIEERKKWDQMSPEEREQYDHPSSQEKDKQENPESIEETHADSAFTHSVENEPVEPDSDARASKSEQQSLAVSTSNATGNATDHSAKKPTGMNANVKRKSEKPWYREKRRGPLDFPKEGVGIQCDINFANELGLHNTLLLRCYSHCDIRVRLMILFVKAWAARRKINSSYNGTLSSYGYVLMVLHFLVNVSRPPVCPNLQLARRQDPTWENPNGSAVICGGYDVQFWRNENEIQDLAARGLITKNKEPLGILLRNFFQYYAQQGSHVINGGFIWKMHTLSLRSQGGILTKEEKGWTGAKTTTHDNKEVRHRYLFAIEDPFELDHNVARTVTHNGIVAIRDEFRRAWTIIVCSGSSRGSSYGELFDKVTSIQPTLPDVETADSNKRTDQDTSENQTGIKSTGTST